MKPYMFVIKAVPLPTNEDCKDIAGAKVHIWVFADSKENAKVRAMNYIMKLLWEIKDFEYEFEIRQEQIPNLHEDEAVLYRKALQYGIAADFLAHPKVPGNPGDPVIKRLL
ncbi:MAG: hypothetical protein HGA49_11695 [Eubacteriaceae bacterium]|nr:hypothetical protein [Eubacteriaceae bacterium]